MRHVFTGIMVIVLIATMAAIGLAVLCATPIIITFAVVIGVLCVAYCIVWFLGFIVNTSTDGIKKIRKRYC